MKSKLRPIHFLMFLVSKIVSILMSSSISEICVYRLEKKSKVIERSCWRQIVQTTTDELTKLN